jgi:glycosyltransferase involved in cell wall biosynthesis
LDNSGDIVKVCLVGQFNDSLDEGKRNVGKSLKVGLELQDIEVEKINFSSLIEWRAIKAFRPDIIHFILTPTFLGVSVARLASRAFPPAKTVISAVHPSLRRSHLLKLFKPDLMLVQSPESNDLFQSMGMKTRFFPNGVDVSKFKPANEKRKSSLRAKFQIAKQDFVVLHLASLRRKRNLDIFKKIQAEEGIQVVIIGREHEAADKRLTQELQEAGCLVWARHFSRIEQVYQMSDCYVFPTIHKKACIETPLSVLEAMACNLPIVSTRFGALPTIFNEGSGLFFAEKTDNIAQILLDLKNEHRPVETRGKILQYSWNNLAERLVEIYKRLLS